MNVKKYIITALIGFIIGCFFIGVLWGRTTANFRTKENQLINRISDLENRNKQLTGTVENLKNQLAGSIKTAREASAENKRLRESITNVTVGIDESLDTIGRITEIIRRIETIIQRL
jgi:regulator of replication initiation timing